jgi:hypothetical protein
MVDADPALNRYLEAIWTAMVPNQVLLRSKLGILSIDQPLDSTHDAGESVAHIHLPFSDATFERSAVAISFRNSFHWPLSGRQGSFNQFTIVYNDAVQDYQATEVRRTTTSIRSGQIASRSMRSPAPASTTTTRQTGWSVQHAVR